MDKMTGILEPKVNGETALDRLFAALCLGEDKPFLMLASYADETGHADDPNKNYLGMAALLADSGKWAEFDKEWKKICEEEGVESPFHMTEFASFQKQFSEKKWRNEEKRRRLLGRFLDAIEGIGALPLGAVVNVSDFRSLTEEQRKALGAQREEPYYVAFQGCTHLLSFSAALKSYPPKRISMVYAELKKFTGQAENLWLSMQKNTFLGRSIMDSYTRGDPAGFTPLQAADF